MFPVCSVRDFTSSNSIAVFLSQRYCMDKICGFGCFWFLSVYDIEINA